MQEYRNEGYKVLEVPEDYKTNFRADYDIALRDIAGISVIGAMGFITQEMITPNISSTLFYVMKKILELVQHFSRMLR